MPPRDTGYRSGYIIASFTDVNNGIVLLIGGLIYYEKFQGKWRKPFSPIPMTLWSGDAKPGDKLTLAAPIQNFNYLRFYVHADGLDSNYVVVSANHQHNFIVTQTGLSEDGKAFRGAKLVLENQEMAKLSILINVQLQITALLRLLISHVCGVFRGLEINNEK
ncbi:hypothetical protein I6H67_04985 [Pediococcus pentosaceus]|uniref:hypothetical protein n=1 Tax=Pediococcus pentosaceus TaxID=1255 RepID=UPI0018E0F0DA|nr:hypothetical protein [Pediococcus pentosaceus]QQC62192.1 hypothetical protein I6H67_04985 [Pediococcus pentosaceus]